MKLYEVSYQVTSVIAAEDYEHAVQVAHECAQEIVEEAEKTIEIELEIRTVDMLPYGWDIECYPYGPNDNKRISDYLPQTMKVDGQAK